MSLADVAAKSMARPLRVLHCPGNIGGNPGHLAKSERALGLASEAIALRSDSRDFAVDRTLQSPGDSLIDVEVKRWRLLAKAVFDFDVIHFNFGQSIMMPELYPDMVGGFRRSPLRGMWHLYAHLIRLADLPLLKALGKGIAVTYQGNDARQGDYTRQHFPINLADHVGANYYPPGSDAWKRKTIATMARYADRIYALNPDLLRVLPSRAEFLPYAHVDWREWKTSAPGPNKIPVVLHAPTSREAKGTKFILEAVERLQAEGVQFEFLLIENMTAAEARQQYDRADLLVDQVLAGWYGGLGVEVMALSKPVICYIRAEDRPYVPAEMWNELPLIQATPVTIYDVLKENLTGRRGSLQELGARSRAFIEKWHDPMKIAARLAKDYADITGRGAGD